MNNKFGKEQRTAEFSICVDDVGFILHCLVQAMEILGMAPIPLAVSAGRYMGKKHPLELAPTDLKKVVDGVADSMGPGLEIDAEYESHIAVLHVGKCPLRAVCRNYKVEIGGELCTLFHHYFAGMVSEHLGRSVRAENISESNGKCEFHLIEG